MSAHVVDRFVKAAWANWPDAPALPAGHFRASPEVARMLVEHCRRYPKVAGDGTSIFGRTILVDASLPRGSVIFQPAEKTPEPSQPTSPTERPSHPARRGDAVSEDIPEPIRQAVHAWNEENRDGGCVHFDKGFGPYRACDDPDNDVPLRALTIILARSTPGGLDAGPGWWHPAECIDVHDEDHNCLDAGGSIIGWRDPVTSARLTQPAEKTP